MQNHKAMACGYSGLHILPDGGIVAISYGHWIDGEEAFVVSLRFTLDKLDAKAVAAW